MGLNRDYIKQIQIKEQDALVKNPNQLAILQGWPRI